MLKLPRSLQGRLLVLVLATVLLVWASAAVLTWFDARHELDELLDSHLAQAAALLVVQQAGEIENESGVDAPTLHRYATKVAFQVFHERRLALRSANAPDWPLATDGTAFTSGFRTVRVGAVRWRVFATQGAERDVQVYVGEQLDSRGAILRAVLRSTLWPMLLALPLLALAVWWAVARGVRPLRQLGRSLAQRPAGALQPVHVADAPAEMAPMIAALNGLFERIGALLETERRFTADAAHELRTPIAAIRAQAQVALAEADAGARHHALQQTLEGCDRATRLVEQLLTLARLEAQAAPPNRHVDLGALVRECVAAIAPHSLDKGQSLELDAADRCAVMGDATLLEVLVRNLVDNAVRYSPPAARIAVRVTRDAGGVTLGVEDSGAGMSDEQVQRLGERFFRVAGHEAPGSGLGWSIVRRIAAAHGAPVAVQRSSAVGGLSVRVVFTASSEPDGAGAAGPLAA
jgi:two-component system, OmpR family, sensor histidine kinase QseC